MLKLFYNLLITAKLSNTDLFSYLNLAKKYDKIHQNTDDIFFESQAEEGEYAFDTDLVNPDEVPVFIANKEADETTCVFYKNLFISFYADPTVNDYIVRAHMKRPGDRWSFKKNDEGGYDVLNPANVNAEVYIEYTVGVLKLNRCSGENYRSGAWNKMFYREICELMEKVNGFTEIKMVEKSYGRNG